jgi:hypothetical protein
MGDICVSSGSYTDKQGQQKNRWEKIGAWFQDDQGRISINVSMIPLIPPKKDGGIGFWANLFTQQNNGQGQQQQPQGQPAPQPQQQQPQGQPAPRQQYYDANGNPVSVPF